VDAVWVEKEVFPFLPGLADALLQRTEVPYVLDFDDATFHKYDQHRVPLVRMLLGNKLNLLLSGAAAVTVGNEYLAQYVVQHGARKVVRIPTAVDLERYPVGRDPAGDVFRIGWIGTPVTTKYLELVRRPLIEFSRQHPTCLVTIGASALADFGLPLEQHRWSLETEASLIGSLHMGIMPLPDAPWERGKCAYKLIQYMACGKTVAASPVGMNREVVREDVGFLCSTDEEWIGAFRSVAHEKRRQIEMGRRGRRLVETEYSLSVTAPKVLDVLKQVCS
jgi:glycosyltransferase involved in cell wall biosynthesis